MQEFGVKLVQRTKALGSGLGAGVRRNGMVLTQQLKAFRKRKSRFSLLQRAGVSIGMLVRTGGHKCHL